MKLRGYSIPFFLFSVLVFTSQAVAQNGWTTASLAETTSPTSSSEGSSSSSSSSSSSNSSSSSSSVASSEGACGFDILDVSPYPNCNQTSSDPFIGATAVPKDCEIPDVDCNDSELQPGGEGTKDDPSVTISEIQDGFEVQVLWAEDFQEINDEGSSIIEEGFRGTLTCIESDSGNASSGGYRQESIETSEESRTREYERVNQFDVLVNIEEQKIDCEQNSTTITEDYDRRQVVYKIFFGEGKPLGASGIDATRENGSVLDYLSFKTLWEREMPTGLPLRRKHWEWHSQSDQFFGIAGSPDEEIEDVNLLQGLEDESSFNPLDPMSWIQFEELPSN